MSSTYQLLSAKEKSHVVKKRLLCSECSQLFNSVPYYIADWLFIILLVVEYRFNFRGIYRTECSPERNTQADLDKNFIKIDALS